MSQDCVDYVYYALSRRQWKSLMRLVLEIRSNYDRDFGPSRVYAALTVLARGKYIEVKRVGKQSGKKPFIKRMEFRRSAKEFPGLNHAHDGFFGEHT